MNKYFQGVLPIEGLIRTKKEGHPTPAKQQVAEKLIDLARHKQRIENTTASRIIQSYLRCYKIFE